MRKLLASIVKELQLLAHDKVGLLLLYLMPVVLVFIITVVQDSAFKLVNDNQLELSEFEINQGIKNVERNKLREKFKIIDQEEKTNVNDIQHLDKKKNIISTIFVILDILNSLSEFRF